MAIESATITGGSPTTVYTSSGNNAITCIWICNTATYDPLNPTTGFVKNGAGVVTTNQVVNQLPIPAGESVTFDSEKMILDNGDSVVMYTPAPYNLVATISAIPV
jgi:hypothetical protein